MPVKAPGPSKKDTKFFADVAKLAGGSGFVQVFRALISPVLSRLFLPEYFGVLQNYLAIAKPIGVVASLRYDRTILLPKEEKYAANLLVLSLGIALITSTSLFLLVWLFGADLAAALNSPELEKYLWFLPLSVAALGLFETLKQWNSRQRKYLRLSAAQVGSEVLGDGLTAGFGFAGYTSGSVMILMQVIGQVFATVAFAFLIFKEDLKFISANFDWALVKQGLVEYKKLPLFNTISNLINNAALYIPSMLLSAYFSTTVAGYYAIGNNAIRLPVSVIANSVAQVFYQRCAKAYHDGDVRPIVEGTMKYLILMSLFPMLLVTIIGKELFVVAFGAGWSEAGIYTQILSLWMFFVFITTPITYLPNVYGKYEKFLVFQLINLATRVLSLVIGGLRGDVWLAMWLFTLSGILVYAVMMFWIIGLAGMRAGLALKYMYKTLIGSLPFLLAVLAFKQWNPVAPVPVTALQLPLDYLALLLVALLSALAYAYFYFLRDKTIKEELGRLTGAVKARRS